MPEDRIEQVRDDGDRWKRRAEAAEGERNALLARIDALHRQAALWRAGIKPGVAAELFLDRLPADVNLDDPQAVREACAAVTAAVLEGRSQLAEATT